MLNFPIKDDNERRWIFQSCRMISPGSISALSVAASGEEKGTRKGRRVYGWGEWIMVYRASIWVLWRNLLFWYSRVYIGFERVTLELAMSFYFCFFHSPFLLSSLIYCPVLLKFSESSRFCEIKETKHNDLNFLLGPATNTRLQHNLA